MAGPRNWYFTPRAATEIGAETDLWIEYRRSGDAPMFEIVVHAAWERHTQTSNPPDWYAQRRELEERINAITAMVGRTGTLEIDRALGEPATVTGVVLRQFNPLQIDNNLMVEYELVFGKSAPGAVTRRAAFTAYNNGREPVGSSFTIDTEVMIHSETREDRTSFKDAWRNRKIRIPNGPGLIYGSLTGITQKISDQTPDTEIMRKRAVEQLVRDLQPNVGKQFGLVLDGNYGSNPSALDMGVVHISSIAASRLDLPDAAVFDIQYVRNYDE